MRLTWRTEHIATAVLLLALALPASIYFAAYHAVDELRASLGDASHRQQIILDLNQIPYEIVTAELEQNRSLLRPSQALRADSVHQIDEARRKLAELKRYSEGRSVLMGQFSQLGVAVEAAAQDLRHSAQLAQVGRPKQARSLLEAAPAQEHGQAVRDLAASAASTEAARMGEFRRRGDQLQTRWSRLFWGACLVSLALLLTVFAMAIQEIRKRRQAQEALTLSHAQLEDSWRRYRELISNVPAAVWSIAQDGTTRFVSVQMEILFGYASTELMQAGAGFWPKHIHPDEREKVLTAFRRLFKQADGGSFDAEFRLLHKDGRWVWVQARGQLAQKDQNASADGVLYDVSESHERAELAARQLALEIRDREMQAGYQFKNEFLASVSHELRTPLSAILGFSDLLLQDIGGPLTSEQRQFAQHIHRGGEHLLALINDILDLSRIEAGAMPLHPEWVDAAPVASEALETAEQLATEGQVQLTSRTEPVRIWADPMRLRQILLNLLSNAIKYTPQGGCVHLEMAPDGERLRIAVRDTGIGIAPDDLPMIFDRFRQARRPNAAQKKGAGLGLAITRHLVERHGGEIRVESTPGKGSCFFVYLPLAGSLASGTAGNGNQPFQAQAGGLT